MKSLFRFLSFLLLAAAVGIGTLDSIRSVSTSSVDLTSFLEGWTVAAPSSLAIVKDATTHYIHPEAWRLIETGLSAIPAFAVLLGLSLLLWMAGYRRRRLLGRFAA